MLSLVAIPLPPLAMGDLGRMGVVAGHVLATRNLVGARESRGGELNFSSCIKSGTKCISLVLRA